MLQIIDKSLIFLCCFAFLLYERQGILSILCFLCAITVVCLNSYFESSKVVQSLLLFYFILIFITPVFLLFIPVMYYDVLKRKSKLCGLIGIIAILYSHSTYSPVFLISLLVLTVFSLILQARTTAVLELGNSLIRLRDTSAELNTVLKNKNKDLMDKQDYEIYLATLRERNRIAREIHDNVGHMLSRSILQVGALIASNKNEATLAQLGKLKDTLNLAMTNIRQSVHDLHDDSVDLYQAVKSAIDEMKDYKIHFDYDMTDSVPNSIKYCFITTVKEALSNVIKHSNATHLYIVLREHPGFYQLSFEDNGTKIKKNLEGGIGLENMQERVSAFDGTFRINTDNGFKIFISIKSRMETDNESSSNR